MNRAANETTIEVRRSYRGFLGTCFPVPPRLPAGRVTA
jgi:hypothetical protein